MQKIINLIRGVINKVSAVVRGLMRRIKAPDIPVNADGRVLIHLGCGQVNAPKWINIDLLYLPHIHHIQNITKLDMFPDDVADLIYACHVSEHINRSSLVDVLIEWRRVLKPGGVLRIAVPDFDYLVDVYLKSGKEMTSIVKPLMGGQNYKYNFHYSVFNESYLTDLFMQAGFKEVRKWKPETAADHVFNDTSLFPLSLNLEASK